MIPLETILNTLSIIAPLKLAESWDNVGLLFGPAEKEVRKIMTCLTLTSDVLAEAEQKYVDLIITHHPIMFRGVKQITTNSAEGRLLINLAKSEIAVYSAHTAYDNAQHGINFQLAQSLGLKDIQPLALHPGFTVQNLGTGRQGMLDSPLTMSEIMSLLKSKFGLSQMIHTGDCNRKISRIGIVCGSGGDYLHQAIKLGCDLFITGEANFHAHLKAREEDVGLLLLGHFGSEQHGMQTMASQLKQALPELNIFLSEVETDPCVTTFN